MVFGILKNRTDLCDIANTLRHVPPTFETPSLQEIREFLKKYDAKSCMKATESYGTHVSDDEHLKNPEIPQSILYYNILDAGTDLIYQEIPCCDKTKCKSIGDELRDIGTRMREENWQEYGMNDEDYKAWVHKQRKHEYAWDIGDDE